MEKTAIYPGTFDPITNGHIDVIERASKMFDKVIVVIAINSKKTCLFSESERFEMAKEALKHLKNVDVEMFQGLTVDFARKVNATTIVRGIRAVSDYEYEFQIALMNRKLNPEVNTIFLLPHEKYTYLNSSIIRELSRYNEDVSEFVPDVVANKLKEKQGCKQDKKMKKIYHTLIVFILTITTCFAQWEPVNKGIENLKIFKIISNSGKLFAFSETKGLLISDDMGENWTIPGIGGGWWCQNCLDSSGDTIFCGNGNGGENLIFWSKASNLKEWEIIRFPGIKVLLTSFFINDNSIYIGTALSTVAYTKDLGINWHNKSQSLFPFGDQESIADIFHYDNRIFISLWGDNTENHGIYYSDDNMDSFKKAEINGNYRRNIKFTENDGILYASAEGGGYASIDTGIIWTSLRQSFGQYTPGPLRFAFQDSIMIVGNFEEAKIIVSADKGKTWTKKDEGLDLGAQCLSIFDDYVFAGTSNGIYRARLDELTAVEDINIKQDFIRFLPNPFSEKIKISFNLEYPSYAKFTAYNSLGYAVGILADGYLSEGMHDFTFDGSALASGTYYYVFQVSGRVETGKLVLIK